MARLIDLALILAGSADLIARVRLCWAGAVGPRRLAALPWLVVYGGALAATISVTGGAEVGPPVLVAGAAVVTALGGRRANPTLHSGGYLAMATSVQFRAVVVVWLVWLAATADGGLPVRIVLAVLAALAVLVLPILLLDTFLLQEAAFREEFSEPEAAPGAVGYRPMVSVHVPCYAEPPAVVTATLDALSRLEYTDYEVLVIDNNTHDPALWQPVAQHCAQLGERFRFYHVDPLSGAKAGALNFALAHAGPTAELIAVVDADYQVEPSFIADLVGEFANERSAFVQTSHDYRDWQDDAYLTGCYCEYLVMYGGYMRSRSIRKAGLITGTMCLIRRRALESVGGWAEWCCTEDSELSMRLHAAGYTGRYVHRTYGRGLVPDEFSTYRRQRHRWIYGPTQEFRRHWRLFLPAPWATPSALTAAQRRLFAHHGLRELSIAAANLVAMPAIFALTVNQSTGGAPLPVSGAALAGLGAGAVSGALGLWPLLRRVVGCTRTQALRAMACRLALFDTRLSAGIAGWRSTSGVFHRTGKFPVSADWSRAVRSTSRETMLGLFALTMAGWALTATSAAASVLPLVGCLGVRAIGWLTVPALALSAERSLRRRNSQLGIGPSADATAAVIDR